MRRNIGQKTLPMFTMFTIRPIAAARVARQCSRAGLMRRTLTGRCFAAARAPMSMMEYDGQRQVRRGGTLTAAQVHDFVPMGWPSGVHDFSSTRTTRSPASDAAVTTGSAGWPPGLYVFENFGAPAPETAKGVVNGARALIDAVNAAASRGPRIFRSPSRAASRGRTTCNGNASSYRSA